MVNVIPGGEVDVEPQVGQPELLAALAPGRVGDGVTEGLHVVHVEADQVADAVREEQRVGAGLDQAIDAALQQAHVDQPLGDHSRREQVQVAIAHAGLDRLDRRHFGAQHDVVDVASFGVELAADRPGSRDVRAIPGGVLGAAVEQDDVGLLEHVVVAVVVQHLTAHAENRVVRRDAAMLREAPLDQTRQLLLENAGTRVGDRRDVCLAGDPGGAAHLGDLLLALARAQLPKGLHDLGTGDALGVGEHQILARDLAGGLGRVRVCGRDTVDGTPARQVRDALRQLLDRQHLGDAELLTDIGEGWHRSVPKRPRRRTLGQEQGDGLVAWVEERGATWLCLGKEGEPVAVRSVRIGVVGVVASAVATGHQEQGLIEAVQEL